MTTESHEGILVLRLRGELDIAVEDELRRELTGLPQAGTTAIVVDLGGVTFLDCVALNILLALARRCARAQVGFLLIGLNRIVRLVIEILHLQSALTVAADEPTAMILATVWHGGPPDGPPSPLLPQPGISHPADQRQPGVG